MASPHTEQIRRMRAETERGGNHLLGYSPNGGAPMHRITGYHQDPYSGIDYSKLVNAGMRHEEAVAEAQRLHREGKRIDPDGTQRTNDNPSSRARSLREETARRAAGGGNTPVAPNPMSGAGNDIPLSPTGGYVKPTMPNGNTPVENDPFGTGHMPMGENNPFSPPPAPAPVASATPPVDSSTTRQPVGMMPPPTDASGNPASDSNPIAGTPAELRQMTRDAATGRTVNTSGTQGIIPSGSPGMRPTQAADFRRSISSKYGTGTNVARTPDQGPGTTTDLMGRTVPMGQFLADQNAVQATKGGPNAEQAGKDFFKPSAPTGAPTRAPTNSPAAMRADAAAASRGTDSSIPQTIGKMGAPGTGTIGADSRQFGNTSGLANPTQTPLPVSIPPALNGASGMGTIGAGSQQFGTPTPAGTPVSTKSELRKGVDSRTPAQEDRQTGQMPNEAYANDMSPDQNLAAARDHYAQTGDDSRLREHFQSNPSMAMQHLQRAQAADERGGRAIMDEEYQQSQSEKASQSRDKYLAQQGANAFTVGHHSDAWAGANPQQALDLADRQSFAKEKSAALRDAQSAMGDYGRQFEEDSKKRADLRKSVASKDAKEPEDTDVDDSEETQEAA